jgi:integrase
MILFGLYTGQRLSDLVRLEWNNIDLERGEVRLVTSKTSRVMTIPMAPALRLHIESLPAGEDPHAPLHPRAFGELTRTGKASGLSNAFSELLMQASLRARPVTPKSHKSRGIGRSHRRNLSELSFHSLRRTATTLLHEAGVPSTVAQALIGHDSEEYTPIISRSGGKHCSTRSTSFLPCESIFYSRRLRRSWLLTMRSGVPTGAPPS